MVHRRRCHGTPTPGAPERRVGSSTSHCGDPAHFWHSQPAVADSWVDIVCVAKDASHV